MPEKIPEHFLFHFQTKTGPARTTLPVNFRPPVSQCWADCVPLDRIASQYIDVRDGKTEGMTTLKEALRKHIRKPRPSTTYSP